VAFFLYRTRWGLRVRVVGEAEEAAATAGINVGRVKFQMMLWSGVFCGLAGAYLSLGYVSLFAKQMTNERGLIALAAIFFANGNPYWTAAVALLFGTATALSVRLPQITGAAPQLLQLIPYLVTVLALVVVGIRNVRMRNRHGAWRYVL
jgi:simple sugar transport system permease protein